ncbi:hypothetical protein IGI37_002223 [Enterococcus sp. AZ194]|uniref:hypothetical protein n=1 Tax=Enterococcus sp. AZ194 TaxID=2774629 RepID=UPI003F29E944
MKDISKLIDCIDFSNALEKNTLHKVYETIHDPKEDLLPRTLKVFILASISWIVSLLSSINWFIFPILSLLIVIYGLVFYFKCPSYLNKAAYNSVFYLFTQTMFIFFICSLEISTNVLMNRCLATIYIIVSYSLSLYIVKIKLIDTIQVKYLPKNKELSKKRLIKIVRIFSSTLATFIAISIMVMQFYRLNKWWINNNDFTFLSGLNNSVIGNILAIISVFMGISILSLITLLPTLLLRLEILADGLLLQKYSEDFRKEYEFEKKEWYGE